ncbi:hypothetical protein EDD86DRAFT_202848 [Gorgonomyces haynaldii]|nr:hypothetical protein EDD86DRAFT_202848 [Gorgonomyces haynaldii]
MIKDARKHTRKLFDEHRDLSDPKAIQKQVKIAEQAETILRRNIVQANKQGDKYVLNITADKEVNYNDSIKDKKKQPAQKL